MEREGAPVRHGLYEDRAALLDAAPASLLGGRVHGEDVVAVDADRVHAVARPARRDAVAVVLLRGRRRDREPVVARDEERRRRDRRGCKTSQVKPEGRRGGGGVPNARPAWKSPSDAAPSPKYTTAQFLPRRLGSRLIAYPTPAAWGICVANGEEMVCQCSSFDP